MPVIRFSHNYPKLWGQTSANLVAVMLLNIPKDANKDLIEYDTKYAEGKYYPLPVGQYIQLIFVGNKHIPFCTIRRMTESKYHYYNDLVGEDFLVAIETEKEAGK